MPAITLDALLRTLKKTAAPPAAEPVYLLHGDEDVLKDEAIRATRPWDRIATSIWMSVLRLI